MKILNKDQIKAADAHTIENEPVKSIDLMERASRAFTNAFGERFHPDTPVKVLAGKGNNGGDGLAISRMLLDKGYQVATYIVQFTDKASEDFQTNRNRLEQYQQAYITDIYENSNLPEFSNKEVVIDAMWGSGLTRPIEGFARNIISSVNQADCRVVAVDMPSGVYCDDLNEDEAKIQADYTFTFQIPKLAFFFPENQDYVGEFQVLDIGLDQDFINNQDSSHIFITQNETKNLLKKRKKFRHKGHFGHALLIAGSYGKIGASIISAESCLRAGSGLLTVYTPACGYVPVQTTFPEAMVKTDLNHDIISVLPNSLQTFDTVGIGPGIGLDQQTIEAFKDLLQNWNKKLVLDADALNILAQNPELFKNLPANTILTPHPGEFRRLKGESENSVERLEKLKALSKETNTIVVLKGGHSAVALPGGQVLFNATGNPGMATAGCGDALTGILTSLLGQGFEASQAAMLGVYLHGLAGDMAACEKGMEALLVKDLINHLPEAYKTLQNEPKRI